MQWSQLINESNYYHSNGLIWHHHLSWFPLLPFWACSLKEYKFIVFFQKAPLFQPGTIKTLCVPVDPSCHSFCKNTPEKYLQLKLDVRATSKHNLHWQSFMGAVTKHPSVVKRWIHMLWTPTGILVVGDKCFINILYECYVF